jgi:hypothetical protein
MLAETIRRLKREDTWKYFVEFFELEQSKLVSELQSGSVNDLTRLAVINSQLDLLDRIKGLDSWAEKSVK